jgi:hypothetical protein
VSRVEVIGNATLYLGDCLEVLRTLPDNSVDSVVTDPPYGLKFMGKKWDHDVPPVEVWAECLRVLKPGGHLLAFAGTRTQHRMACRIEDAGFEIRDMIAWVYGSGFPKSLDVSKAIDKAAGAERDIPRSLSAAGEGYDPKGRLTGRASATQWCESCGRSRGSQSSNCQCDTTGTPATPDAERWQGWGTAMKPALEPITMARKPLVGTVAANVLAHGTGALNIDGCRVDGGVRPLLERDHQYRPESFNLPSGSRAVGETTLGRWPANLIHDGSDEVVAGFPNVKGGTAVRSNSGGNTFGGETPKPPMPDLGYNDTGSAARFFYCAKASKSDRGAGEHTHPTVKPTNLMRYLCRLVTPAGGTVLDPYMGSGSTGVACHQTQRAFIGIEREPKYFDIACRRIEDAQRQGRLIT